jgi:hypothetical protein
MSDKAGHLPTIVSHGVASHVDLASYRTAAFARALARAWVLETIACVAAEAEVDTRSINQERQPGPDI